MRTRILSLAVVLMMLAACSATTVGQPSTPSGPSAGDSSAQPSPATVVAAAVAADQLPAATGAFGEKPTLTFPSGAPPASLQRVVLSEGSGPLTQKGDWLITRYLGQVWARTVFDNTYDKGTTVAFQIGFGTILPGWDVAMVGVPVGSRVMLSLPPADGYGATGKPSAGIAGSDTLVFVVDIVQAVAPTAGGQKDATPQPAPTKGPVAGGDLGAAPTITVPPGLPEPTAPVITVLATGTGAPVKYGTVLAQYIAVTWAGQPAGSTWPDAPSTNGKPNTGPKQLPVGTGKPFAGLAGIPLGSRVLVQLPASTNSKTGKPVPATASVLDLLAQAT